MTKLRGKTPTLISASNGKPSIATAKKKRECKRCKVNIISGEKLFEIPSAGGFNQKKSFCMNCFKNILVKTRKDIDNLESILVKNTNQ